MSFISESRPPRWGDVYLSAIARGISACGDFLAATAIVLALQARGAGGIAVAAVLVASALPLVVCAPLAGRLADRVDSRLLLVTTGLAQAAACATLAFTNHPVAIVALVALLATGLAVTQPTLGALVPDMVGQQNMPRATAISQTAFSMGALLGPALAGVLVGEYGLRLPLLVDAATYGGIALLGLALRTRRGRRIGAQPEPGHAERPATTWRLKNDVLLLALVGGIAAAVAAVSAVNVIDVFFIRETLRASATMYGLLAALWTGAMMLGAWLSASVVRKGTDGALVLGMLGQIAIVSAVVFVAAFLPSVGWLVPLWIVGGVVNGGLNVFAQVVLVRRVPAEHRGRGIGTLVSAVNAANIFGYVLGGALLTVADPRVLIAGCGVAGLVAVAAALTPVLRAATADRARTAAPQVAELAPAGV